MNTKSILSQLRLEEENLEASVKVLQPPKVRKSLPGEYIRVHPVFSFLAMGLSNVPGQGVLFVAPSATEGIKDDLRPTKLHLCVNREGEFFFYPRVLNGKNGMSNPWSESAENAMFEGTRSWVRIKAGNGSYDLNKAIADLGEPDWSKVEGKEEELLEEALKSCFISSSDHIVLRKLRGEL